MENKIKKSKHIYQKGFTLIELLVTITMFVIITGVVLVNSNKFDNTILLNNFAYDVALTIKQAQLYGVSVKENNDSTFNSVYGVLFDKSPAGSLTNFALFESAAPTNNNYQNLITAINSVDINKPCSLYYPNCIQKYTMRKGTYIKQILTGKSATEISPLTGKLLVMFKRPSPEPIIFTVGDSTTYDNTYVKIILSSAGGDESSVVITRVGQIYVVKK